MESSPLTAPRDDVGGSIFLPDSSEYDSARRVWNGAFDRHPAAIIRCHDGQDVARAVRWGQSRELAISIRGGGHNFAGTGVADGALMLDLSAMGHAAVDPRTRRARVGGGATWKTVDAATQAHGLVTVGGVISNTGVGGLTLGGGMGWLTSWLGLTIDNLLGATVVLADGSTVTASAEQNADLFWALRGGGGNFGVVTEFEFALHQMQSDVQFALFFWPIEQAVDAMTFGRDLIAALLPDTASGILVGMSAPAAPFVAAEHHGKHGYALIVANWGDGGQHQDTIAAARKAGPLFELVTAMPYVQLQQLFDGGNPWGIHAYEKTIYLDELNDDVITVCRNRLADKHSAASQVALFAFCGRYREVSDADTAFGGSRDAQYLLTPIALSADPAELAADRAWAQALWDDVLPFARGIGGYVNYMAEFEDSRVRASYGEEKYRRLANIKRRYDPGNVFRFNANIDPAEAN